MPLVIVWKKFPVSGVAGGKECKRAEGGILETL